VCLQLPPLGPVVGGVVMVRITQVQTSVGLMDDDPQILADPNRPEVFVLGLVKLVKLHTRALRVHLQIKCRGLYGLLLLPGEPGEAIGKGVGNPEFH
jgi:hypothetical protein